MMPKYHVEYGLKCGNRVHAQDYRTDDPVACEEFVTELLEHRMPIKGIKHEGVDLPAGEFRQVIKNAATTLAAKHVADSLNLNAEQVHFQFGLAS